MVIEHRVVLENGTQHLLPNNTLQQSSGLLCARFARSMSSARS